jgi:hypothetical protein
VNEQPSGKSFARGGGKREKGENNAKRAKKKQMVDFLFGTGFFRFWGGGPCVGRVFFSCFGVMVVVVGGGGRGLFGAAFSRQCYYAFSLLSGVWWFPLFPVSWDWGLGLRIGTVGGCVEWKGKFCAGRGEVEGDDHLMGSEGVAG